MKLRNKKTGEIVETGRGYLSVPSSSYHTYHSLAELNEEWEDYEEPAKPSVNDLDGKPMKCDLKNYYKAHLYEYAYNRGYDDAINNNTPDPCGEQRDIYWQDEMDYYICADYYGLYIGGYEDWSAEDKEVLAALGFKPSDFEEGENE